VKNPRDWPGCAADELAGELGKCVDLLAAAHITLAGSLSDRERAYWPAYDQSSGESVSARAKDAEKACRANTIDVIESRGNLNALVVQVEFLRLLLGSTERDFLTGTFPPNTGLSS
jgi:hypothetical protein